MSNLQKNHVKIDVFNEESKYRFDPNQVHSSSFHPHTTPKKKKIHFGTDIFFLVEVPPAPLGFWYPAVVGEIYRPNVETHLRISDLISRPLKKKIKQMHHSRS